MTRNTSTPIWVHSIALKSVIDGSKTVHSPNGKAAQRLSFGNEPPFNWTRAVLLDNTVEIVDEDSEYCNRKISASDVPKKKILLANDDGGSTSDNNSTTSVSDLIHLTHLHEPAVVHCLRSRYNQDAIYTSTGPILLALNPFKYCADLYGRDSMMKYYERGEAMAMGQNFTTELGPHVYASADAAFRAMMRSQNQALHVPGVCKNQSILVSGESGAGKTMTTKFIMGYLAELSQRTNKKTGVAAVKSTSSSTANGNERIEQQVLQSNPILESFGNARTIRNDNSSRFGKFIEIQFSKNGNLIGACIDTYLLEKVRLITQSPGERNYHIFYEMLDGASDKEREKYFLGDLTADDFAIASCSGTFDRRDGVIDADTYKDLNEAMATMGFSDDVQESVKAMACAMLHSSNLTFKEISSEESKLDRSNPSLKPAVSLLGVTADAFEKALCSCTIEAGGETFEKKFNVNQASKALEALMKASYGALFTFLVGSINKSITVKDKGSKNSKGGAFIGVLDIFGFESFESNSFEQLCINYCNEALQQQFNKFVFKLEQQEYDREGIEWSFIEFPDNQDVLDLIDMKRTGIIPILDEQCRLAKCTDRTFATKMYQTCSDHPRFTVSNAQKVAGLFEVNHYAGPVEYDTVSFLEKNKDELPKEATDLLLSSSEPFLKHLACIVSGDIEPVSRPRSSGKSSTSTPDKMQRRSSNLVKISVGGQFSAQLRQLREKIETTAPHYVRCLKPNSQLVPDKFMPGIIADQLRCAGVLEAVRVSRVGYPQRYTHANFVQRYRMLAIKGKSGKNECDKLINSIAKHISRLNDVNVDESNSNNLVSVGMQMGKTKVFLRRAAFDAIERLRLHEMERAMIYIQSRCRSFLARIYYEKALTSILVLQCSIRGIIATRKVHELRRNVAASEVQCTWRRFHAERTYRSTLFIVCWIQRVQRGINGRNRFRALDAEKKSIAIQSFLRSSYHRRLYQAQRKSSLFIQCLVRCHQARKILRKLRIGAKDLSSVREERDRLRQENQELRKQLEYYKAGTMGNGLNHSTNHVSNSVTPRFTANCISNEISSKPMKSSEDHFDVSVSAISDSNPRVRNVGLENDDAGSVNETNNSTSVPNNETASNIDSATVVKDVVNSGVHSSTEAGSEVLQLRQLCDEKDEEIESLKGQILSLKALDSIDLQRGSPLHSSPIQTPNTGLKGKIGGLVGFLTGNKGSENMNPNYHPSVSDAFDREETDIHRAIYGKDESALKRSLDECEDLPTEINKGDFEGKTPLHLAAITSDLKMAAVLLQNMSVANAQDKNGNTPLHFAKDEFMVRLLLTGGANPNIPNEHGLCALHLSVTRRNLHVIKNLLDNGADVNAADDVHWYTPLHLIAQSHKGPLQATGMNDSEDIASLESKQATLGAICTLLCSVSDPPAEINYQDYQGNTPLHHAAVLDEDDGGEVMRSLLKSGANPNIKNERGQTPLLLFCYNQAMKEFDFYGDLLNLLLSNKADVNMESRQSGCTPIHLALYHHDIDTAVQLVRHGANLNALWNKPTSWEGFWPETGSPQVTPWDMLVETADRYQVINAIISPQSWAKAASNCMQCSAKLITFGKHHCRNCGRTVCSKCSPGCLSHKFFPRKTFRNVKVSKTKRGGIRVCLECEGMLRARKGQEQSHSSLSLSSRSEFSSVFAPSLSSQYGAGCSSWEEESVCSPFQHVGDDSLSHHGQLSPSPTSAQENLTASPRQNTELLQRKRQAEFRNKVLDLLRKVAPDEIPNIDDMIQVFSGREDELLKLLSDRFQEKKMLRLKVINVLQQCAPEEVSQADEMIQAFAGRENDLIALLQRMQNAASTRVTPTQQPVW